MANKVTGREKTYINDRLKFNKTIKLELGFYRFSSCESLSPSITSPCRKPFRINTYSIKDKSVK